MAGQDVRTDELRAKDADNGTVELWDITDDVVESTGYHRAVGGTQAAVYSSVCLLTHADSWNKHTRRPSLVQITMCHARVNW